MIEFDVASSHGDHLEPIVWTCHTEQREDGESILVAERNGIAVSLEEYKNQQETKFKMSYVFLNNAASTIPYGVYDQLAGIQRDSSGNEIAGWNCDTKYGRMSYADAVKYLEKKE